MLASFTALLLVTALTVTAGCADRADRDWQRTWPAPDRPAVRLVTDDGAVRVTAWDRPAIEALVTTRGWRIGGARGVRITETLEDGRLTLEVRVPRRAFFWSPARRRLEIELRVPSSLDLAVVSDDGDVAVGPVAGAITVTTGDGHIALDETRGTLRLRSSDGRIVGVGLDGAVEARASDGRVHLEGRFDSVAVTTGDGSVLLEARPGSRLGAGWSLTSGDGSLTVRLPNDLGAELDAHARDGRISVNLPLQESGDGGRRRVSGSLNGGGPPLRLRAADGPIRVVGY